MTRSQPLPGRLAVLLLAAATLTCNGSEGGPDPNPVASQLAMAGGDDQVAPAGEPLPNPIGVRVTDENGDPVAGVEVTWTVSDDGSVSSASVETGGDGRASVAWTLGPTPGEQSASAAADGLDGSPVQFTATATPEGGTGEPTTLAVTVQPPSSALTGEVFAPDAQPAVRLDDDAGAPIAGVAVTATVASGGGTLQGETTATTGANGVARFGDLGIEGTGAQTLEFSASGLSATSSAVTLAPLPPEATSGEWDAPVDWDIVPLHINLLPTGKILAWGRTEHDGSMGQPRLWDPGSGTPAAARTIAADTMLFCAGHALMPDGRLMVSGGHKSDDRGLDVTNIFDPVSESWASGLPKMAKGRWYPTVTTLPDGRMITVAGKDTAKTVVMVPEIWENNEWVRLPGASLKLPYYPRDFVDPKNGLVFYAGERVSSRWLDVDANKANPSSRGIWTDGPDHLWPFNRDYGSAVMYDEGKIMYVGGGGYTGWDTQDPKSGTPTATAEKIDLMAGSPSWSSAGSMSTPRRHLNATVLPDGQVLVTGGVSGGGFNEIGTAVRQAEIWNPATNDWTTLAANSVDRGYHSVSLLLPDGTVLHGASGNANIPGTAQQYPDEENHEIFHPPYLFRGARPTITAAPATVGYGEEFLVATPNAAQITTVRWIHLGTVTHAFDQSARANRLGFTPTDDGVMVTAPDSPSKAPPGHYMLFILNRNGVPSTARIVRVQ